MEDRFCSEEVRKEVDRTKRKESGSEENRKKADWTRRKKNGSEEGRKKVDRKRRKERLRDMTDERDAAGCEVAEKRYPRLMLAAGASGSGKTTITCGLLQVLKNRGLTAASFKCGPDYIDPMFHERVLKTKSRNLDTFFTDEATTRCLFARNAAGADVSVFEGVMGYYDGLGGISDAASAYDLARVTGTPVVLIVDTKGMSLSVLAYIRGFLTYREDSGIRGVILNRMSGSLYPEMKRLIEEELDVKVYGYVPKLADCAIGSRHLGLVIPSEVERLEEKLQKLADTLEESLEIDGLLALARSAPPLPVLPDEEKVRISSDPQLPDAGKVRISSDLSTEEKPPMLPGFLTDEFAPQIRELRKARPVIAVARDEAFCFIYEDNLQLLRDLGAQLVEFSPIRDDKLPKEADGLLLYGGYPELYARQLSENVSMLRDVRERIENGLPCMAECGGFMYLHRTMEDMEGKKWPMAGVLDAEAFRTEKLTRFGYIELSECVQDGDAARMDQRNPAEQGYEMVTNRILRGHEFHYFDSTDNGESCLARKPLRNRTWKCMHRRGDLLAGFPHLYYYSNPGFALDFCLRCARYRRNRQRSR